MQLLPENQDLKSIFRKFMDCFFEDQLILTVQGREDVFETPALCRIVKKIIGAEIMDHVSQRYQVIELQKIRTAWHPLAKTHINFFSKIGFLITSRILGEQITAFAFNIMKLYLEYAHIWPILHTYRMWILQVTKDTMVTKHEEKIAHLKGLRAKLFEQIEMETKDSLDGWNILSK